MSAPHSNNVPKNRLPVTFADVDDANSPNSIAQRDSEGGVRVRYPTQPVHAATKGYVDEKVGTSAPTSHSHPVGDLTATGTASATTYLRGDGSWTTPPNTNTTYAVPTQAEVTAGTATSARTISAAVLKGAIQRWVTGSYTTAVSAIGQALNTATDAAAARTAIGAGTSSLALGTTASTAKAGNYQPTWAQVTSKPTTFPPDTHTHTTAQVTGLDTALSGKVTASGATATLWTGSQSAYDALPEATRNAIGFIAVIV